MKRFFQIVQLLTLCIVVIGFTACSPKLKPLTTSQIQVTPQPMERVGNQVPVQLSVSFPAKWFPKKGIVRVTPVLHFAGRMSSAPTYTYQGESYEGNYRTVSYRDGGVQTMEFSFPYEADMARSELFLHIESDIKGKKMSLPPLKVAEGMITTTEWANISGTEPAWAPDNFRRELKGSYAADIQFLIQQAEVRAKELRKAGVQEWKDVVENARQMPNTKVEVEIQAYASPDGGVELNEKLSAQREKNTTSAIKKDLKDVPMTAHYTSQDWEGFRELLERSNIQDKELVLRVLSMYQDPEDREREIKNLSFVFRQLADEILPQLRRSRLIATVTDLGKSDEEIQQLASSNPARLRPDELLHAATLTKDHSEKLGIYLNAVKLSPKDYRAYNNIAALYLQNGDKGKAQEWFAKAASVENNSYTNVNMALLALEDNQIEKAQELLGRATDIPEADRALGLLYLSQGRVQDAVKSLGVVPSRNTAVAQILNKQYADALQTLKSLPVADAVNYYLRAVIAARSNDVQELVANLTKAFSMDRSLLTRALGDLEFAPHLMSPAVKALFER